MLGAVTLLLIVLLAVGFIAISPVALGLFKGSTREWERLSFIGQTYGAASAVLSVLAVRRQQMYVNMIISEWQMSFETKALGETRLRAISREMFEGPVGRRFWRAARDVRIATAETKSARRFHEILDEEYRRALAAPAADPPSGDKAPLSGLKGRVSGAAAWAAAGAGAIVALGIIGRRRLRRRRSG